MWPYNSDERGWLAGVQPGAEHAQALPAQQSLPFIDTQPAIDDNAPVDPKIFVAK